MVKNSLVVNESEILEIMELSLYKIAVQTTYILLGLFQEYLYGIN